LYGFGFLSLFCCIDFVNCIKVGLQLVIQRRIQKCEKSIECQGIGKCSATIFRELNFQYVTIEGNNFSPTKTLVFYDFMKQFHDDNILSVRMIINILACLSIAM